MGEGGEALLECVAELLFVVDQSGTKGGVEGLEAGMPEGWVEVGGQEGGLLC